MSTIYVRTSTLRYFRRPARSHKVPTQLCPWEEHRGRSIGPPRCSSASTPPSTGSTLLPIRWHVLRILLHFGPGWRDVRATFPRLPRTPVIAVELQATAGRRYRSAPSTCLMADDIARSFTTSARQPSLVGYSLGGGSRSSRPQIPARSASWCWPRANIRRERFRRNACNRPGERGAADFMNGHADVRLARSSLRARDFPRHWTISANRCPRTRLQRGGRGLSPAAHRRAMRHGSTDSLCRAFSCSMAFSSRRLDWRRPVRRATALALRPARPIQHRCIAALGLDLVIRTSRRQQHFNSILIGRDPQRLFDYTQLFGDPTMADGGYTRG